MSTAVIPGDPPIELILRRSARARRISLRVSSLDGRVTLSMPKRIKEQEALDFAKEKSDWIRKHLTRHAAMVPVDGTAPVLFDGEPLSIRETDTRRVAIDGTTLWVPRGRDMIGARVKAFLKQQAKLRLTKLSHQYAKEIGREFGRIAFRDTRSRWGSCSANGNLMYSWRLIMAPPEVSDYVAAHEVAHLIELNHSAAYWAIVKRICPDFEQHKHWLRHNGSTLHRFQFDTD